MPAIWIDDRIDLEPLRKKLAEMVATGRLPAALDLEAVLAIARAYDERRQIRSGVERMKPSDAREWIEATIRQVGELRARLHAMPEPIDDAMALAAALGRRPMDSKRAALAALGDLSGALTMAERQIEKPADRPGQLALARGTGGRPRTPATWLVIELARVVEAAGAAADAKPNGHLVQLLGEVLCALGEPLAKSEELARKALARR